MSGDIMNEKYPSGERLIIHFKDEKVVSLTGEFYTRGDYWASEKKDLTDICKGSVNQVRIQSPNISQIIATTCFMYFEYFDSICINDTIIVVEL